MYVKLKRFKPTQLVLKGPERAPFVTEEGSSHSYLKLLGRVLFNRPQTDTQGEVYGGGFVGPKENSSHHNTTTNSNPSTPLCTFQYTKSGFGFSNGSLERDFIPLYTLTRYLTKTHQLIHMDSLVLTNLVNLVLVVYDTETFIYQVLLFNTLSQEATLFPLRVENPVTCFSVAVIPPSYYSDSTTSNLEISTFQGNSRIQLVLGLQSSLILGYDFELSRDATQTSSVIFKVSEFTRQLMPTVVPTCLYLNNKQNPTEFTITFGGQDGKFGVLKYEYDYTTTTPNLKSEYNSFGLDVSSGNFELTLKASPITFMDYLPSQKHSDNFSYLLFGQGSQPFLPAPQRHSPQFSLIRISSDFTEVKPILEVTSPSGTIGSFIKASISYHETGSYLTLSRWNGSPQPKLQISISHFNWTNPQFDPIFETFLSGDSSDVPIDVHVDARSGTFKVLNLNSISDPINFCSTTLKIRDISSKYLLQDFIKLVRVGLATGPATGPATGLATGPKHWQGLPLFQSLVAVPFPGKCGIYPIVSLDQATELANFINDGLSPIKKELFYYMLLDYPLPIELTTFARIHHITEPQRMLLKAYWNIDHGHYQEGVNYLCSSKLNPHFPHQILDLLIASGQSKPICLYWDFLGRFNLKIIPKSPQLLVKVLFRFSLRNSLRFISFNPDDSKMGLYTDFFSLLFEPGYLTPGLADGLRMYMTSEVEDQLVYFMSSLVEKDSPHCKAQFRSAFLFYLDYLISKHWVLEAVDFYQAHQSLAAAFGITTMPRQLEEASTKLSQLSSRSLLVGSVSTHPLKRPSDGDRSYSEIKVAKLSLTSKWSPKSPLFSTFAQNSPGLSLRNSYQRVSLGLSEVEAMPLPQRSIKFIRPLNAFDLPKPTIDVPVHQINLPVECETTNQITESGARNHTIHTHSHSQDIISISSGPGPGPGSNSEHQVGNGFTNGCLESEADASSWVSKQDCYSEGSGLNESLGTLNSFSTHSLVPNNEPELSASVANFASNLVPDAIELPSIPGSVSSVASTNLEKENGFSLESAQSSPHDGSSSNSSQDQLTFNSDNCHSQSFDHTSLSRGTNDIYQVSPVCESDILLDQEVRTISSQLVTSTEQAQFLVSESDPNHQDLTSNNDLTDASSHSISSPSQDTSVEYLKPTLVDLPNHQLASLEKLEPVLEGSVLCKKESLVKVVHSTQDEPSDEVPQTLHQSNLSNHSLVPEPNNHFGINRNLSSIGDSPLDNDALSHISNKNVDSSLSSPKSVTPPENSILSHTSNNDVDSNLSSPKSVTPPENTIHLHPSNNDVDSNLSSKSVTPQENVFFPHPSVKVHLGLSSKSGSPSNKVALLQASNKSSDSSLSYKFDTPSENDTLSLASNNYVVLSHIPVDEVNPVVSPKIDSLSVDQMNACADNKASPLANLETINSEISSFAPTDASPRSLRSIPFKNLHLQPVSEDSSRQHSEDSSHTQFSQSNQSTPRKKHEDRFPNFIQLDSSSIDGQIKTPRKRTPRTIHNESNTPKPKKSKRATPRQK